MDSDLFIYDERKGWLRCNFQDLETIRGDTGLSRRCSSLKQNPTVDTSSPTDEKKPKTKKDKSQEQRSHPSRGQSQNNRVNTSEFKNRNIMVSESDNENNNNNNNRSPN